MIVLSYSIHGIMEGKSSLSLFCVYFNQPYFQKVNFEVHSAKKKTNKRRMGQLKASYIYSKLVSDLFNLYSSISTATGNTLL